MSINVVLKQLRDTLQREGGLVPTIRLLDVAGILGLRGDDRA